MLVTYHTKAIQGLYKHGFGRNQNLQIGMSSFFCLVVALLVEIHLAKMLLIVEDRFDESSYLSFQHF